MKTHSSEKQHLCSICKKTFAQLRGLTQHLPVHSDINQFRCEVCNMTFKFASTYYSHRKTHQKFESQAHICQECGRECPSRFSLYLHRKNNHSLQTFSCSECGKVFKRKDILKQHLIKLHCTVKTDNAICTICLKKFRSEKQLEKHFQKKH